MKTLQVLKHTANLTFGKPVGASLHIGTWTKPANS